jgi:hypothetical protein
MHIDFKKKKYIWTLKLLRICYPPPQSKEAAERILQQIMLQMIVCA